MKFENEKQKAFHGVSLQFAEVLKDYNAYDFLALMTGHPEEGIEYRVASDSPESAMFVNLTTVLEGFIGQGLLEQATATQMITLLLSDAMESVDGNYGMLPPVMAGMLDDLNVSSEVMKQAVYDTAVESFRDFADGELSEDDFMAEMREYKAGFQQVNDFFALLSEGGSDGE